MKAFYLSVFVILLLSSCKKEETINPNLDYCWVEVNGTFEYLAIDQPADYINGGEDVFYQNIASNIKYPAEARENSVEGEVLLNYEITVGGMVETIVIIEDIGSGCGEAAKEALEAATEGVAFSPAELNGSSVRVKKDMVIKFKLE